MRINPFLPYNSSILVHITKLNLQKLLYVSMVYFPVNILHIVLFWQIPYNAQHLEKNLWRNEIIWAHSICAITTLLLGSLAYYLRKKGIFSGIWVNSIQVFSVAFYMVLGVAITAIDQRITTNITAYLVVTILLSVVLLTKPVWSLIIYIGSFILFYFSISLFQDNADILLSNRVNGISFTCIAALLSLLLWNNQVKYLMQQQKIEQQKNELLLANDTKDTFFSIIAHDLRGPMNNIVSLSELLQDNQMPKEEQSELQLALMHLATSTSELLENLLQWALVQKGNIEYHPAYFAIGSAIQLSVAVLQTSANQKNLTIHINAEEALTVYADKNLFTTTVRNLLSNAVKFSTPNGKITVSAHTSSNTHITVCVQDDGVGLTEQQMAQLFTQKRTSTKGTRGETGTGLGLLLCKEFVEKNGGHITLHSQPKQGTKFCFTVPTQQVH